MTPVKNFNKLNYRYILGMIRRSVLEIGLSEEYMVIKFRDGLVIHVRIGSETFATFRFRVKNYEIEYCAVVRKGNIEIIEWDNSPHRIGISTYPHHVHIRRGNEYYVEESSKRFNKYTMEHDVRQVLEFALKFAKK